MSMIHHHLTLARLIFVTPRAYDVGGRDEILERGWARCVSEGMQEALDAEHFLGIPSSDGGLVANQEFIRNLDSDLIFTGVHYDWGDDNEILGDEIGHGRLVEVENAINKIIKGETRQGLQDGVNYANPSLVSGWRVYIFSYQIATTKEAVSPTLHAIYSVVCNGWVDYSIIPELFIGVGCYVEYEHELSECIGHEWNRTNERYAISSGVVELFQCSKCGETCVKSIPMMGD